MRPGGGLTNKNTNIISFYWKTNGRGGFSHKVQCKSFFSSTSVAYDTDAASQFYCDGNDKNGSDVKIFYTLNIIESMKDKSRDFGFNKTRVVLEKRLKREKKMLK